MAKTWISVATPVTKRMNVTESGSTRKPIFTCSPPDGSHVKRFFTWDRWSAGRSSSAKNVTTDQTKDSPSRALPIHPATRLADPLPEQEQDDRADDREQRHEPDEVEQVAARHERILGVIGRSAPRRPDVVGGGALPAPEDRHDDREPDRDLGRGDDEREEHDHLAGDVVRVDGRRRRT